MPIAPINDIELYYEIEGDGPWMVFAHGGGGTHLDWWRQVYDFRAAYRCLWYDLRGLGQSTGAEDYQAAGADLLALMDYLDIPRAILNGHSAGGGAVSYVAQVAPWRVEALIMTATPFGFITQALSKWAGGMLANLDGSYAVWDNMYSPHFRAQDPSSAFLYEAIGRLNFRKQVRGQEYVNQFKHAYEMMMHALPQDYSGVLTPTIFVGGAEDAMISADLLTDTAKALPNAQVVLIPFAGHYVMAEKPALYRSAVVNFLAGLGG